jgi:hypothetical protein
VFVYQKTDDPTTSAAMLDVLHTIFVGKERSADYQMTRGIRELLESDANEDDLVAFMQDRLLPVDDIAAREIAREILAHPPVLGYLTISNALQWRLQYRRVIDEAGKVEGLVRVR